MHGDKDHREQWFDDVVSTVNGDLLRFLRSRTGQQHLAEDLAQEVYLRLLRMDDVRLIRNPRAFVIRLAAHAVHEWRMLARNRMPHAHEPLQTLVDPADDPAERIERDDRLRALSSMLATLSPKCQAVLLMHRRDGMTCQEIAARMELSVGMVKKYLARGLTACRTQAAGTHEQD
ncbi:RNA polymerase sigma factor [Luteimonas sp. XNQY3]|nr:RNA polymerase sigma factor [Luteimonas sp. XNQY3]MCD9005710.1 RNA polymerase sigma factor [Luteimonas sp. XNQY3]